MNNNRLLNDFLTARQLIDTVPHESKAAGKSDKPKTVERPAPSGEDSVKMIIETKPSKKVVMEFLKRKVAQYTDISSDEE